MTSRSSPETPHDRALMRRVVDRDPAAFEALYDAHIVMARAISYRILRDRVLADDVCQEAFLAVWRAASKYDPRLGPPASWILQIVRNRAIDHLRRASRIHEREVPDDAIARHAAPHGQDTETVALRAIEDRETRGALDVLSDPQRRVIELSFFAGRSQSEIATLLDVPLGTVKARMLRGLRRMRDAAEQEVDAATPTVDDRRASASMKRFLQRPVNEK